MAWGGKGGQVDRMKKTGKSTVERAVSADKEAKAKAAWLKKTARTPAAKAGLDPDARWKAHKKSKEPRKKSSRGGMSNQRGSALARRRRQLKIK